MSDQAPVVQFPERPDRRRNTTVIEANQFTGLDNTNPTQGLRFSDFTEAVNGHIDDTGMLITRRDGTVVSPQVQDAFGLRGLRFYAMVSSTGMISTYRMIDHARIADLGQVGAPPYVWCAGAGAGIFMQSPTDAWEIHETSRRPWGVPIHTGPTSVQIQTGGKLRGGVYRVAMTYLEVRTGREGGAASWLNLEVPDGGQITMETATADHQIQVYLSVPDGAEVYRAFQMQAGDSLHISSLPGDLEAGTPRLAEPLETLGMYPPPSGDCIAYWDNKMAVGVVDSISDASVVYWSRQHQYHLFLMAEDYLVIPGQIRALADSPIGLIMGTDRAVWRMGDERPLLLDGCPPGNAVDWDRAGNLYLQTHRGPIRISADGPRFLAPTVTDDYTGRAALAVVEEGGFEQLIVAYEDGEADVFNPLE